MGNNIGARDGALVLARFREADDAYQSASDADKPSFFARRHAALMLVLGTHPSSHDEVCDVMNIAIDELTKDFLHDGPVPRAVMNALMNCLRAIEDFGAPRRGKIAIEHANASVPPEPLVDLDAGVAKLDSLATLLAYLANSSGNKEVQGLFFAVLTNVETIRDHISGAADRLMDAERES